MQWKEVFLIKQNFTTLQKLKMKNFSLSSLALSSLSNSPHFVLPESMIKAGFSIKSCKFKKFANSFFVTSNRLAKIQFTHSTFSKFAKHPIEINKFVTKFENQNFYNPLVLYSFEPTTIKYCKFEGCHSCDMNGGAILTFSDLNLSYSLFDSCSCLKTGGAVMCHMSIEMKFCYFANCYSFSTSVLAVDSTETSKLNAKQVTIKKCNSGRDCTVATNFGTSTYINDMNITRCYTDGTYGSIWCLNSEFDISSCVFDSSWHSYYSSGLGLENMEVVNIEMCNFVNLTRKQEHDFGGVCLYIIKADISVTINECAFIHTKKPAKPSICINFKTARDRIMSSCFSESYAFESSGKLEFDDCSFEDECPLRTGTSSDEDDEVESVATMKYREMFFVVFFICLGFVLIRLSSFVSNKFVRSSANKMK